MTILGTKKFWMRSSASTISQAEDQILKNSGYINIQLFSVNYKSNGNFWQNVFGGSDNIALSTNVKYQTSTENIEATSIQDVRKVDVNSTYNLGLQRNIAIKIPANADALELTVRISAVKDDKLQAKFDMLNKPEFQAALQLTPTIVGKVLTITSLAKRLFTESDSNSQLEATYAGIISSEKESSPVSNGKLTKGYLLLISTNDGLPFTDVDESKFSLKGDTLYYETNQVENTYAVFSLSFEPYKGDDEKSLWFRKYAEAVNYLDKIHVIGNQQEIPRIYAESKNMWIEGNALLAADATYLYKEKTKIKTAMLDVINKKYAKLTPASASPTTKELIRITPEIFTQILGSDTLKTTKEVLPNMGAYLEEHFDIDPDMLFTDKRLPLIDINAVSTFTVLGSDAENYAQELEADGKTFKLI